MGIMTSPALVDIGTGIAFRPDANTKLWLPGQDDAQSAVIRDRSGNGNDCSITGAVWKRNDKGLRYLDFDGLDDLITTGDASTFKWLHGAEDTSNFKFTIKTWFFATSWIDDILGLLETGTSASGSIGVSLWLDNRSSVPRTRRILGIISNDTAAIVAPDAGDNSVPNDTDWHQLVWTYDQTPATGNSIIYLDKTPKTTDNKSAETPSTSNSVRALEIGRIADSFSHYGGLALPVIEQDVIWTQAQITSNYQQERPLVGM